MYLRNLVATAVVSLTIAATPVLAEGTHNFSDKAEANAVVSEYKALRNQCTLSRGDERKSCFNALNKQNDLYASAKKYLAEDDASSTSAHYVTFAE